MKIVLLFIGALIHLFGSFAAANEFQIYLPGLQYRYENDQDQSIRNRRYENYNISGIIYSDFVVGAEFNQNKTESTSGSIKLDATYREFNLSFGYLLLSQTLHDEYVFIFDLAPVAFVGVNRTMIETTAGTAKEKSLGESNLNLALGGQASLKFSYFIFQMGMRYAYSRSYEPSFVPVIDMRLGARFELN